MGSHRRTLAAAAATILASLSLYPIFSGTAWFWGGVGAALVVAVAGTLTRLRRLPVTVCAASGLVLLILYLDLAFENARLRYHLFPTPNSLRLLWDLAGQGFNESAKYAPPVPELPGMMLLAAGGIGLTALLTDVIAVRLESAALAGLPLLLLITEPFTLSVSRSGIGTIATFALGTAGYLALLSSEGRDRIREWERPNPGPDEMPDTRALATTGRRVGFASVALALCVPLFIPGLHATRLFGGQPGIGGIPGPGGAVGFPDPNATLSNELHETRAQPVFKYTSTDANPDYFQIYVLDNLTDSGWRLFSQPESLVPAGQRLPTPPGMASTASASLQTTVVHINPAVGQDELSALPVPYPPKAVAAPGDLKADRSTLMIFDSGVQLGGLSYTVTSVKQAPSPAVLSQVSGEDNIGSHYLEVPKSYDSLQAVANTVVRRAGARTKFEEAIALQDWLSGASFTYTLGAPTVTDASSLSKFLNSTRKGYCQQFSFSMAVLARELGIPSRVAYGFTEGSPETGGLWQVTTHDAHAWPELYFPGYGWLRFEPTPTGPTGQGTAEAPQYTLQPAGNFQQPVSTAPQATGPSNTGASGLPAGPLGHGLNLPFGGDSGLTTPGASSTLTPLDMFGLGVLALVVLLLLLSAAPAVARLIIKRRRWRSGARDGDAGLAHAAWRELRDDLVDYRAGYSQSESPRALAARVGKSLVLTVAAEAALRRIAMAEERARYAARPVSGSSLRDDSATVRYEIARAASRPTRWLARLFPSSVVTPAMIRLTQAADFTGRLNTEWFGRTRLGGRLSGAGGRSRPAEARTGEASALRSSEPPVGAGARHE